MIFKKKNYFYFTFFIVKNDNALLHYNGLIETYEKEFPFLFCKKMITRKINTNFVINFFNQICEDEYTFDEDMITLTTLTS